MSRTVHGVLRGRTIELSGEIGLEDGQEVEVQVRAAVPQRQRPTGEGLRRTAGALADDPEWDAIMIELEQARKRDRREQTIAP